VWNAVDEPMGISFGGNVLYSNKCCDRTTRVVNISTPNSDFNGPAGTTSSTWNYYSYDLNTKIPGFNSEYYFPVASYTKPYGSYGNENGYYGFHGDTVAPITYNGKVYMHRSNAIIAFGSGGSTTESAKVTRASVTDSTIQIPTDQEVVAELESEIQKIISAGHLRPGYHSTGIFDLNAKAECGDELIDYWSTPGENIYILLAALPHLSPSTQTALRSYIQNEYQNYGPGTYTDIGWSSGVQREAFITPDDVQSMMSSYPAESTHSSYGTKGGWDVNPLNVYAAWKYALEFGNANEVYNSIKGRLDAPLSNAVLTEKPYLANAQIAGHIGYLELEKLAGQPETASVRSNLDQLISTRINTFSKDAPATNGTSGIYCRSLNVARNFMFMPPEVAQILKDSKKSEVQTALGEYEDQAPYWFVSKAETAYGEGSLTHLYDYNALFQAKALIVEESTDQLGKYIDVPSMERGDLYHIQNLVSYLGTEPCEASFPDICGSIFIDYIEGLHSAGVVNGYSDGYFRPSNPVTRDEMATFISRAFGFGVNTGGVAFPDAGSSNAHFESIQTLKNLGVIGGYSDGTYKPSNYVTRAEVTKFIANAFEKKGIVTTGSPTHSFPDIDSDTQSKFGGFINFVTNKESQGEKIMKGYSNGNFGPGDNLTREQMSKVVFLSMESL
ncbi:S-layer homology domain-containing protein, partial [Candidatus Dojkabacteria bacterium]|nr:S-layer homology domain-containing protein [Candidatus Dojkabacteria bacterium]